MCVYVCVRSCFFHAFMGCMCVCVCVCVKIDAYIHKIPTVSNFNGLMLFRTRLLIQKYKLLRAQCQTSIARISKNSFQDFLIELLEDHLYNNEFLTSNLLFIFLYAFLSTLPFNIFCLGVELISKNDLKRQIFSLRIFSS